jgi:hypothetical protein
VGPPVGVGLGFGFGAEPMIENGGLVKLSGHRIST